MAIAQPPPEPVTCGYDYNIFISTPPESLECPVCLLIVRKPHLTACCGALICQVHVLCMYMYNYSHAVLAAI